VPDRELGVLPCDLEFARCDRSLHDDEGDAAELVGVELVRASARVPSLGGFELFVRHPSSVPCACPARGAREGTEVTRDRPPMVRWHRAMAPPPLPIFSGRTVTASPSGDLLAIRPRGVVFREPPGTVALFLPSATLVAVEADGDAVVFIGDFRRVDRPSRVRLAPMDPGDALALARAVAARFGLPKRPRVVEAKELVRLATIEFVTVVGSRKRGHIDCPDFEGTLLIADAPIADGRYRVTGFLHPAPPAGMYPSRGASGPTLAVLSLEAVSSTPTGILGAGHAFEIEAAPGARAWRVRVDGRCVPMTLEETELTTTNAGSYDKTLRARARAEWVDAPELLHATDTFEVRSPPGRGFCASCRVSGDSVAMYNTVIHDAVWFDLTFPEDLSTVAVTIMRTWDSSS